MGEVIVFSGSGARKWLPPDAVDSPRWTEELYGGYGEFSVSLNAKPTDLTHLVAGDRVEVWENGNRLYRGYITDRNTLLGSPDRREIKGYGRMFDLTNLLCTAPVILSASSDLADIFAQIVLLWVRPQFDDSQLLMATVVTGVPVPSFDCTGKTVKQALDDLCDLAPGTVCWGVGVDTATGKDLLYLRLIGEAVHILSVPGRDVTAQSGETNTSDIKNALELTGGDMVWWRQNLLPNADFEKSVGAGDVDGNGLVYGNLLINGGFESGGVHNSWGLTGWTRVSAASAKQNGGTPATDPDAFSGTWCVELSDISEETYQQVTVQAGRHYGIRFFLRPSDTFTAADGAVYIEWYDGTSTLLRQDILSANVATASWERFDGEYVAPVGAVTAEIRLKSIAGSLQYDAVSFWEADTAAQKEWALLRTGDATVVADWVAVGAKHGVYCVRATVTGTDTSGDNEITLTPTGTIPLVAGGRYEFFVWAKTSGQSTHQGVLRVTFQKTDGTAIGTPREYVFSGTGLPDWTWGYLFGTAPQDTAMASIEVVMQSDGDWYFDTFTLMDDRGTLELFDGADASHAPGDGTVIYLPDGPLSLTFEVADLITSVEDTEAHDSATVYGRRVAKETVESIVTFADAQRFAKPYLLNRSKQQQKPVITLVGSKRDIRTGEGVRLVGEEGPALSGGKELPIVRIQGEIDSAGLVTQAVEMGRAQATLSALIRQAAKEEITRKR